MLDYCFLIIFTWGGLNVFNVIRRGVVHTRCSLLSVNYANALVFITWLLCCRIQYVWLWPRHGSGYRRRPPNLPVQRLSQSSNTWKEIWFVSTVLARVCSPASLCCRVWGNDKSKWSLWVHTTLIPSINSSVSVTQDFILKKTALYFFLIFKSKDKIIPATGL